MVQGLDVSCAKALNHDNCASFYKNLQQLYEKYNYARNHIWNCDESSVQDGHSGGGRVFAKKGSHYVYGLILKAC
jgi:hypothetical protein